MNEQPHQPEIPDDDLFKYAEKHPKPIALSSKETPKTEDERDPCDTCPSCKNGGFCGKHTVRPRNISSLKFYNSSHSSPNKLNDVNKELQITGHKPKPKEEIPLEEFIEGLNQTRDEINREAS